MYLQIKMQLPTWTFWKISVNKEFPWHYNFLLNKDGIHGINYLMFTVVLVFQNMHELNGYWYDFFLNTIKQDLGKFYQ